MFDSDMMVARMLQSMGALGWSQVVMAAIVILIPVLFWDRVSSPGLLRAAGILVALSFLIPAVMEVIVTSSSAMSAGFSSRRGGGGAGLLVLVQVGNAMRPISIGLAVLFAFLSVVPSARPQASIGGHAFDAKQMPQRPQPFSQSQTQSGGGPPNPSV